MPTSDSLLVVVEVDGRPALAALSQVEGAAGRVTAEVGRLEGGFRQLQSGLVVPRQTADELDRIAAAARSVPKVSGPIVSPGAVDPRAAQGLNQLGTAGGQAQQVMFGLGATLQDATQFQFGFANGVRAITNNLQPLITGLAYTATQAAATGTTVGASLGAALTGPAGILIGLTLVAATAPFMAKAIDAAFTTASERAADAAVTTEDVLASMESLADAYAASTDAVFSFASGVDTYTLSTEAQAEAMAELARNERDSAEARIEAIESLIAASTITRNYGNSTSASAQQLATWNQQLRNAQDDLDFYTEKLNTARSALVSFSAEQRSGRFGERLGLETDAERKERESAEAKAQRDEESARRRAEARAASEARRAERRAATEARQAAEARTKLDLQLRVDAQRQATDQALEQAVQERDARLEIARGSAALEQQVRLAYARETERILERDLAERERRVIDGIERVRQAQAQTFASLGTPEETLADDVATRIRTEAAATAEYYAALAREQDGVVADADALATLIERGGYAEAERLAVIVAEAPALAGVLDLILERIGAEARLVAIARERRLETEREAREIARADADRADRLDRANAIAADPSRAFDDVRLAADRLAAADTRVLRLRESVGAVDAAIAQATGVSLGAVVDVVDAVSAAEADVRTLVVDGQRIVNDEVRGLVAERARLAEQQKDAEIDAATVATDAIVDAYQRRYEFGRRLAADALDVVEAALTYRRQLTDTEIAIERDGFEQKQRDLDESLRAREISQREYDLEVRRLAEERSAFEKEVAEDTASAVGRTAVGLAAVLRQTAIEGIKSSLAEAAAKQVSKVLSTVPFPFNLAVAGGAALAVLGLEQLIRGVAGFAVGGQVEGPGSGTSDSILAWLSNGEHVITARAAGGQHDALRRLNVAMEHGLDLDELLRLLASPPRYATGGPVLSPRPVPRSAPLALGAPALDWAPVVAELRAGRTENARQARENQRSLMEMAELLARAYGDPDAARRVVDQAVARTQQLDSRGGSL